jgi:hypothetical protein
MRAIGAALAAAGSLFEPSRIIRWTAAVATVLATITAVLLAAFVAVAIGLT